MIADYHGRCTCCTATTITHFATLRTAHYALRTTHYSWFGSWGIRLAKLMLLGCVPLIIQPRVRMWLDEFLPYRSFSLVLSREDIPQLHTILPRISQAEHARMRRAVDRYARAFNWGEGGGAYALVVKSLERRARHLRGWAAHPEDVL